MPAQLTQELVHVGLLRIRRIDDQIAPRTVGDGGVLAVEIDRNKDPVVLRNPEHMLALLLQRADDAQFLSPVEDRFAQSLLVRAKTIGINIVPYHRHRRPRRAFHRRKETPLGYLHLLDVFIFLGDCQDLKIGNILVVYLYLAVPLQVKRDPIRDLGQLTAQRSGLFQGRIRPFLNVPPFGVHHHPPGPLVDIDHLGPHRSQVVVHIFLERIHRSQHRNDAENTDADPQQGQQRTQLVLHQGIPGELYALGKQDDRFSHGLFSILQ